MPYKNKALRRAHYARHREKFLAEKRKYYINNKEKIASYKKDYAATIAGKRVISEYHKKYYLRNKKRIIACVKLYRKTDKGKENLRRNNAKMKLKYPLKLKARSALNHAVRGGIVFRKKCQFKNCKVKKTEAHHPDYSQPLKVRWLCTQHHRIVEKRLINGK